MEELLQLTCQICGKLLVKMPDAAKLRERRLCYEHIPEGEKCHAITNSGRRCGLLTVDGSDFCKGHQSWESSKKRPNYQPTYQRCGVCGVMLRKSKKHDNVFRRYGLCEKHLPENAKCAAITQQGSRCRNLPIRKGIYCGIHKYLEGGHPRKRRKVPSESGKRYKDYYEYINSDEWKEKSRAMKKKFGYKCQLCNEPGPGLSVHHRTYENLYHEPPEDLVVLCDNCHKKFHNII